MERKYNYFDEIAKNKVRSILLMVFMVIFYGFIAYTFGYYAITSFSHYGIEGYFLRLHILPYKNQFANFTNLSLPQNLDIFLFSLFLVVAYLVNSYYTMSKTILKYHNAKEADRKEYSKLYTIIEGLSGALQIPMPKVYIEDNKDPNAFATGVNKYNASITVTSGLLEMMDKEELTGILSHEASHIANGDIQSTIVAMGFIGAYSVLAGLAKFVVYIQGLILRVSVALAKFIIKLYIPAFVFIILIIFFNTSVGKVGLHLITKISSFIVSILASKHPLLIFGFAFVVLIFILYLLDKVLDKLIGMIFDFLTFIMNFGFSFLCSLILSIPVLAYYVANNNLSTISFTSPYVIVPLLAATILIYKFKQKTFRFFALLVFSAIIISSLFFFYILLVERIFILTNLVQTLTTDINPFISLKTGTVFTLGLALIMVLSYKVIFPLYDFANKEKIGAFMIADVILSPLLFLMAVIAPVIIVIIRLAVSRKREFLADHNGARIIRNPRALASALEKLKMYNDSEKVGEKSTFELFYNFSKNYREQFMSMMYFNPGEINFRSFIANLFSTHPPLEERIRILRSMH